MSRIPTCAWLYVTRTMSNSSSLCGYSSRKRALTASRAWSKNQAGKRAKKKNSLKMIVCTVSVRFVCVTFYLDKGESRSRGEGFVLVFNLVSQILLHSLLLKHLLLMLRPKQDAGRNSNSHCVLRLWLQRKTETGRDNDNMARNRKKGR